MTASPRSGAALLLALSLVVPAPLHAATYRIKWLLGHPNLDYFEEAARAFKQTVERESKGDISIEIVTAEQDAHGDAAQAKAPAEIAAKVSRGEAQMGHSYANVMSTVEPRLQVFEAPYLFRGYRHLEGVFEGPVGAGLLSDLKAHGIEGLSFTYSGGANGVATFKREVRSPEDLKGLKVGVYGDELDTAWLSSLGAVPVAIRHDRQRILGLSEEGGLDAAVITWRNFEVADLNRRFRYFNMAGSTYLVSVTYINQAFFASLPPKYRDLLRRASRESARLERAQTIQLNEISKREMLARGVLPVHLDETAESAFVASLRAVYAGPIERIVGRDLLKKIRDTADAPVAPVLPRPLDLASR